MGESKIANDKIWLFVEQKWKPQIPVYFKNVLKVCGYNNGITIASIGDDDIKYMENEVRNGNVSKYFADIPEEKVFEDCTKSAKDFTFTLGHRKFLMAIVNFLKVYIDENGPDSLNVGAALDKPLKKSVAKKKVSSTSTSRKLFSRKRKFSEAANLTDSIVSEKASIVLSGSDVDSDIEDVGEHIRILMKKTLESTITSLKKPPFKTEMFNENLESVKNRISNESMKVNIKTKGNEESEEEMTSIVKLEASVCCFLCSKPIILFHKPNETNNFIWNTSNFDRHLKTHYYEPVNIKTNIVLEQAAVKQPRKKVKLCKAVSTVTKAVILENNDNIETEFVHQEEEATPPKRAVKASMYKFQNRDVSTITKAAMLGMNENIEAAIVHQEENPTPPKRDVKEPLKRVENREGASTVVTKAVMLVKNENIETVIVHQDEDTSPPKRAMKTSMNKFKNREVVPTVAKAVMWGKNDNIETVIVHQEEDPTPPKRYVKEPLKKVGNCEGVSTVVTKGVMFGKNDNIETNILHQEEDSSPPKGAMKVSMNKFQNREVASTLTKAVMLGKKDNIETLIVHQEVDATPKRDVKEPLKKVENRELFSTIRKAVTLKKANEHNEKSNKVLVPSLVCYSDSSEGEEDEKPEILMSHDHILKPKGSSMYQELRESSDGITNKTFEIASNFNANGLKYENSSTSSVPYVPVLQNGYNYENMIITKNTCGFDSIFSIFACLYADNLNYRSFIDSTSSKFFELIKKLSTSDLKQSSMKYIYMDRNILLKDLYCNLGANNVFKKDSRTLIDCKTGIGGLYAELCFQIEENIASGIEERACHRCRTIKGKILPFLSISNTRNLYSLQASVEVIFSRRACLLCKTMCDTKRYYNNLLVLEVEPNNKMEQSRTIALKNLTQTLQINHKEYKLCAVIQYIDILSHYTAVVRRSDNNWKCYDDIRYAEFNVDDSIEIKPFLLFYIATYHHNEFKSSFSSFLRENQIRMSRMPLIRKISKCDSLPLETLIRNNII